MKITVVPYKDPTVYIEDFAQEHHLEMVVIERGPDFPNYHRWYANFRNVRVLEDGLEKSVFGNGSTPHYAILAYIQLIEDKKLINYSLASPVRFKAPETLKYEPSTSKRSANDLGPKVK